MNFSNYYPSIITQENQPDPQEVLDTISDHPDQVFHLLAKGYNLQLVRDCFNKPNCRVVFYSEDGILTADRKAFIDQTPPDRPKSEIVVVASNFTRDEAMEYLNKGASFHVWNEDTIPWVSEAVTNWVRLSEYAGRIMINATGYTFFLLDMFFDPVHPPVEKPIIYFRHQDGFLAIDILDIVKKGKEKIVIFKEGFADGDLEEFETEGATIVSGVATA